MNINNTKAELDCPNCNKKVSFTFGQLAKEETITCNSCKQTIKLTATGNSKNEIKKINNAFADLQKTLKKLGR